MSRRLLVVALFVTWLFAGSLQAQRGAIVRPTPLNELSERADRIVHVHVISARIEPLEKYQHFSSVVVTVSVEDTLKGPAAKQITFRQLIWDARDRYDLAGYRKGREFLMFLLNPNADGLSGTVGLDQGRMEVMHEASGETVVHPKLPSRMLLRGAQEAAARKGTSLPQSLRIAAQTDRSTFLLADMKTAVRELVRKEQTK